MGRYERYFVYVYVWGALSCATLLSKMCALEIGRARRKSNDGKKKKTSCRYVTNETPCYKSHFCIQYKTSASE